MITMPQWVSEGTDVTVSARNVTLAVLALVRLLNVQVAVAESFPASIPPTAAQVPAHDAVEPVFAAAVNTTFEPLVN